MFTGLVEETGKVTSVEKSGEGKRITIEADKVYSDAKKGDSISVSGACITVEDLDEGVAEFFLADETLKKTWFSDIEEGDMLNMERSLKAEDRMGGHMVQGHIEAASRIESIEELEEGWNFSFETPEDLENYVVEKGFVAVEGISLTVTAISEDTFSVTIIPETWEKTNLSEKQVGDRVNIETDVTARYIEKMVEKTV